MKTLNILRYDKITLTDASIKFDNWGCVIFDGLSENAHDSCMRRFKYFRNKKRYINNSVSGLCDTPKKGLSLYAKAPHIKFNHVSYESHK